MKAIAGTLSRAGPLLMMLGCSDGGGPTPPVPGELSPPRVSATLGFGDAPVTGEVVLDPGVVPQGVAPWRYAIDLDGDGATDARGEAGTRTAVGYAFVAPGPHPIGIVLTRGVEAQSVEEVVVVNDPGKIEVLGSVELPTIDPMRDVFIGIAVDRSGQNLFVGGLRQTDLPVYTLDTSALVVSDSVKLDMLRSNPEGLSAAPDEDRLYVAGRDFDFTVLSTPGLEVSRYFERVVGQFAVLALPNRRAYVGGIGRRPVRADRHGDRRNPAPVRVCQPGHAQLRPVSGQNTNRPPDSRRRRWPR